MSFVQIGFLGALAALAIPIIVHLVFRQRARRIDLGTLRFLRVVLEQNARRRRVMRWLLLALRMACVALLAFLFARPYLLASRSGGEKETVVVLIDRSATMELKQDGARGIERAVAAARQMLSTATDRTRYEIAFFDHKVHPLVGPDLAKKSSAKELSKRRDYSAAELIPQLVAPEACHGATDYGAAMEWARDELAKAPPGPRKLHVFTDFQQSGLAWSEVDALPEDVATHLHDLGRSAVNNVAVIEARPERAWLRPDEQTTVHVTVYNGGPFTVQELNVVLQLTALKQVGPNRRIELREQARIEAGASESFRFDLPPLTEGLWKGTVAVDIEDDLPLDNQRHVALLASPPYQALLVDGSNAASAILASTYFLDASLRLAPPGELYPSSPFEPRQIAAADSLPDLTRHDVVVLSNVGDLDRRDAERLASFVEQGGGLLVFTGENVTAERTKALETAGLTAGRIMGVMHATDLPLRLQNWDDTHPIFAPFSDPQLGDLQRLSFSASTIIEPAADAKVLARFRNGKPAVLERRLGEGTIVWFASTADRQWSDWTRSRLYLPLMYQLLGYQSGLTAGGRVRSAILEGAQAPSDIEEPGVHAKRGHTLVLNPSPREAETDRCSPEEFVNRFGLHLAEDSLPEEAVTLERVVAGTELIDTEIWPWLASLLLAVLMTEGLVANRTSA